MQTNGSEMLRLACGIGVQRGIRVIAPVHDAVVIEAPVAEIEGAVWAMQAAMAQVSRTILGGFELATDVEIIRYPDRYTDERGIVLWHRILEIMDQLENPSSRADSSGPSFDTSQAACGLIY
jgi:DNA polymerase-1